MIFTLRFGAPQADRTGRLVREPRFVPRTALPLSAACLVANGVREQLARMLAIDLETELVEPVVPAAAARGDLFADATVFRVKGRSGDAFVSIRPKDASRLVAAAFAERARPESAPLSEIERATLDRILAALPSLCAPLCGTVRDVAPERAACAARETVAYFEVRLCEPVCAAIGFALGFELAEEIGATLTLDDLSEVTLHCSIEVARGNIALPALARLVPGSVLPMQTSLAEGGSLSSGGAVLAHGTCGSRGERAAFMLTPEASAA